MVLCAIMTWMFFAFKPIQMAGFSLSCVEWTRSANTRYRLCSRHAAIERVLDLVLHLSLSSAIRLLVPGNLFCASKKTWKHLQLGQSNPNDMSSLRMPLQGASPFPPRSLGTSKL